MNKEDDEFIKTKERTFTKEFIELRNIIRDEFINSEEYDKVNKKIIDLITNQSNHLVLYLLSDWIIQLVVDCGYNKALDSIEEVFKEKYSEEDFI